jgi:hypothetical protein
MPSGHDDWPDDGLGWTWREVVKWVLITIGITAAGYAFLVLMR